MAKLNRELQLLRSRHTMLGNLRQKDGGDLASRHLLNHHGRNLQSFLGQSLLSVKATGKANPVLRQREMKLQPCSVLMLVLSEGWLPPMRARFHQKCCRWSFTSCEGTVGENTVHNLLFLLPYFLLLRKFFPKLSLVQKLP